MNNAHTIRTTLNEIVSNWNGSLEQPPIKTYGIPWFNNVFNTTDYNNSYVIKQIVESRQREEELITFLQRDEVALKLIVNAEWDEVDHKRDGTLTIDNNLNVHYRDFPDYDYEDRYLYSPTEDIYGHIAVYDKHENRWYVMNNYADYAIKYLSNHVVDFPLCADLVIVNNKFNAKTNTLVITFKCDLCSNREAMKFDWVLPLDHLLYNKLIISKLLFGDHYCRHIDGDPPKNYHSTSSDNIQIEKVGNRFSSIKTYTRWLGNIPPEELLSCTSKRIMSYGQIQYVVKKERKAILFDDVIDNLYYLHNQSTMIELKYLKIPPSKDAMRYFGFLHYFNPLPGTLSLYSPVPSHIVFANSSNIYLDTTGLLIAPTRFKFSQDSSTWYNFYMSTDSPFGGVQGIVLLDHTSTSKSSESMYLALVQYSCSYNRFLGKPAGPICLDHKYFAHVDCDRAT